jgi:hypothetical protein
MEISVKGQTTAFGILILTIAMKSKGFKITRKGFLLYSDHVA